MANLNSNTTYNTAGSQSPLANLSGITKLLQENAQKTSADTFKSSLMAHYNPSTFSSLFGSPQPVSYPNTGVGLSVPVAPQTPTGTPPPAYERFLAPTDNGGWVLPSGADPNAVIDWPKDEQGNPGAKYVTTPENTSAVLRNWPEALGGGQYVTDPTQPGAMIKSGRVAMNTALNPGAKQKLLGNLSPQLYQLDHIIPLWAGGADTLANLEIYETPKNEEKTRVQAVALTLLSNHKIDLNQARQMAFTWQDKDPSGLPSSDEVSKLGGFIPLATAEKMAAKWDNDLKNPSTMKYFGESFKENMGNFGRGWLPAPLREFAKGLVGGGTAGIVPGTGASEDSGTLGKIGNVAGNIVGTITGLGLLSKGIGATFRGIRALTGAEQAIGIGADAMKASGLVTDIGDLTAKAVTAKKRAETLSRMASSAGLLSLWGQIGLTGKEATGQTQAEFSNHVKQFFSDIAFGTLLGSAGQNVKGYARVGLGTAALSLMEGQTIGDSLQNAGLMTALHGMAYTRGMLDPKVRIGGEEAYKMSAVTMNKYLGDVIPTVKKGQPIPEVLNLDIPKLDSMRAEYQKLYPNDQRFKNLGVITNNDEAIHFIEQASRRQLGNLIAKSDGTISQDEIKQEMTRIVTAKNQLYNQTLPPEVRAKKEWEDLVSMGAKLKPGIKTEQIRIAQNSNENLKKIPIEIPKDNDYELFRTSLDKKGLIMVEGNLYKKDGKFIPIDLPTGKGGTTGYGGKIDVNAKANINDFALHPEKYDGKIYIPKTDNETASIQRGINFDYIANGDPAPTEIPEHTLRVFVRTKEGQFKDVSYIPQEKSYNDKKYNLNTTHVEQYNRIIHTIEISKSPEDLQTLLAKDKSKINLTNEEANKLFSEKSIIKSVDPNELLQRLKPNETYWKLDSNLNNTNLFNKMDELGIDNLVIDPLKAWEINGARPRYNPDNPYLNLDISVEDWLRSMAIKDGTRGKDIPVETQQVTKTIEKIVNQQKAENTSKAISEIVPKTKALEQTILPLEKAPGAPVLAPKSPVEAYSTPEMSNTSSQVPNTPKDVYRNPVEVGINRPNNDLVDQFFGKMVHDIEYRKVKPSSPEELESTYNNIIDSFKATNPGISEKDFLNTINDAKNRARAYVQDTIDDMYKGTKRFGTEDIYERSKEKQINPEYWRAKQFGLGEFNNDKEITDLGIEKYIPKNERLEYEGRDTKLSKEFGLKLQEPNKAGIQYLELDKRGNPVFSEEYLKAHPKIKGTPLDVWGSFLGSELKANKAELSLQSKTWGEQWEQAKSSKSPYLRGVAETVDKILSEKYDVKDAKTGETKYSWKGSWKLNSGLKKIKSLFETKNEEGQLITQPFRRIMAGSSKKSYSQIVKDVAIADKKTALITEKAREAREKDMIGGKEAPRLERGQRIKDPNQVQDVSEDLTPYDLLHSGLVRQETRDNLINRYNNIISTGEIKPEKRIETRIGSDGEKILGTKDEMDRLFKGIKKLSEFIPESKNWKSGKKIVLKNAEPTFEEGVNDGIKIGAKIMELNSSPGNVSFENIKKEILKNNPNKQGGYASLKAILGGLGLMGAAGLANITSTTSYKSTEGEKKQKLSDNDLGNIIKYMESSGGIDKGSADKGEVKWQYGLTNIAIKELKRVGLIEKIDVNNEEQVRDASIKYFKLMKERNPELTDAEIYTDFYWGGAKGDQRERTIKKFNSFTG